MPSAPKSDLATLPPFRLSPRFRTRIWGFQDLAPWFDYKTAGEPIGEVWLTGDECLVDTGPLSGVPLKQIAADYAAQLMGVEHQGEEFPLLIKILFPKEKLSVQVHPDDAMAKKYAEPRGKTECWYVLDASPDAHVALGLKPGVNTAQIPAAISDQTLEDLLQYVPLANGDMIFVDAGTVHAILPGSVILETQQNSDLTFRLYDYGRPRELHLEKSLEAMTSRINATHAGKVTPRQEGNHTILIDEKYFRVDRFALHGQVADQDLAQNHVKQLEILFIADGDATLSGEGFEPVQLHRCQVAVVPASARNWTLSTRGKVDLIRMIPKSVT